MIIMAVMIGPEARCPTQPLVLAQLFLPSFTVFNLVPDKAKVNTTVLYILANLVILSD